jgi:hypothetical protein
VRPRENIVECGLRPNVHRDMADEPMLRHIEMPASGEGRS